MILGEPPGHATFVPRLPSRKGMIVAEAFGISDDQTGDPLTRSVVQQPSRTRRRRHAVATTPSPRSPRRLASLRDEFQRRAPEPAVRALDEFERDRREPEPDPRSSSFACSRRVEDEVHDAGLFGAERPRVLQRPGYREVESFDEARAPT